MAASVLQLLAHLALLATSLTSEDTMETETEWEAKSREDFCRLCTCGPADQLLNCTEKSWSNLPKDFPACFRILDASRNKIQSLQGLGGNTVNLNILLLNRNYIKTVDKEFASAFPDLIELNLSNNELEEFPGNLQSGLEKLHLSGNKLTEVPCLESKVLEKLKELYLADNEIDVLNIVCKEYEQYIPLSRLEKLDLSGNQLRTIPENAFRGLISLRALSVARNQIVSLDSKSFTGLAHLYFLDLSNNHLNTVQNETLAHLDTLKYLYLRNNYLIEIPSDLPMVDWLDVSYNGIRTVNEMLKESLYPVEHVNLGHNPFHCDCHLLWLKEWYDRREYILNYIDSTAADRYIPTCATPYNLEGDSWDFLADDVFTCVDGDTPELNSHTNSRFKSRKSATRHELFPEGTDESRSIAVRHLNFRVGQVEHSSVTVHWDPPEDSHTRLVIRYHQVGEGDTSTTFTTVQATHTQYTLKRLEPGSVYIMCLVQQKDTVILLSDSDDCIEAKTELTETSSSKHQSVTLWIRLPWILDIDPSTGWLSQLLVVGVCLIISVIIVAGGLIVAELTLRLLQSKQHKD